MVFYAGKLIKEIIRMCSISYRVEMLTMSYMTEVLTKKKNFKADLYCILDPFMRKQCNIEIQNARLCVTFSAIVYHFCSNRVTFKMLLFMPNFA